jgi:PAS domain S-box-containing protein
MYNILIIENEKKTGSKIGQFLNDTGYNCKTVYDGGKGIQFALKYKPDVILCELTLSEFSGFEVFNILQKVDYTAPIPFIILSKKNREEEIIEGLQLGMDGFLAKPVNYQHLECLIKNKINRKNIIKKHYEKKFGFLMQNPFLGVFIAKNYSFIYANEKFLTITGYDEEQLKRKKIFDIIFEEDITKLTKAINNCIKEIISHIYDDIRLINKHNEIIHTLFFGNVFKSGNDLQISVSIYPVPECLELHTGNNHYNDIELTKREKEVLILICKGYTNYEISNLLFLSERTIHGHRARLMDKTNTRNTVELVKYAIKNNYFNV